MKRAKTREPRAKKARSERAPRGDRRGRYDRSRTPQERRSEQRARLLAAAAKSFARKGYAQTSVDSIVRIAGMSRRTFYEHFEDVADALVHVYETAASVLLAHVEQRVRAETEPLKKLEAGLAAYLTMIAENADLARVLYREIRVAGPSYATRHELTLMRFVLLLTEGIAQANLLGTAARPPDDVTVFALVAGIEAAAMRYVDRGQESRILEAQQAFVELVVRAFAAADPARSSEGS
jgi:AcrR family transcriptional regulator